MKKIFKLLSLSIMLFALAFCFTTRTNTMAASKPGKPVFAGKWKNMHPKMEFKYRMKWKKVKGAAGYEVKQYYKDVPGVKWSGGTWSRFTKHNYFDISFSATYKFKIKVRAYKLVNGKKIYGKWATSKVKKIKY